MKLKVELVWEETEGEPSSSIYLTSDGRILIEGKPIDASERKALSLPQEAALISVDRRLVDAIKTML